jgi:D-alanyl-D-alanine carboxypeptidase
MELDICNMLRYINLENIINKTVERFNIHSIIVSFKYKDKIYNTTGGNARSITCDSGNYLYPKSSWQYPLRSITKIFTSYLIIYYQRKGLLNIHDTIDKYLEYPIKNKDIITIKQLMNMSSGIADYTRNPNFIDRLVNHPNDVLTLDELNYYGYTMPNLFQPGTNYQYSNTNSNLLGKIIENISGLSYRNNISILIKETLNLSSLEYPTTYSNWNCPHLTGYQPSLNNDSTNNVSELDQSIKANFSYLAASGGLICNCDDTHVFIRKYLSPKFYQYRQNIFTPLSNPSPEYDTYGLNLGKIQNWIGHTGEGLGFTSLVFYNPCLDMSVVIFCNISNAGAHPPTVIFRNIISNIDIYLNPQCCDKKCLTYQKYLINQ